MKTLTTLLAVTLLAAGLHVQAQSTTTATSAAPNPEATAPADATSPSTTATTEAAAPAEPTLSPAAMRARAMTSHGRRSAAAPRAKSTPGFKDGVTMRDGKVVATESGHSTYLDSTSTVKLVTGLEATGTGLVTRPDGTTETLQEGDFISLTGRYVSAQEQREHMQSLKQNLKEDRKIAAKKARSPLRQLTSGL